MMHGTACVVARTKKLVDDYITLFTRAGIRSYAIKSNKVDDRSFDGLRVATMHRVKGLEFKYVFIAAVNNRIVPLFAAIQSEYQYYSAQFIITLKLKSLLQENCQWDKLWSV